MIAAGVEIGAEGRLGIQQIIPEFAFINHPEWIAATTERLHYEIGVHVINHIVSRVNPVVIRFHQTIEDDLRDYARNKIIRIIIDLHDVEKMRIVELDMPPFDFISRAGEKAIVEWQCNYCGTVNLVVEHLECRKCGAPRRRMR